MLANLCGVICAAALIWSMGPLQPPDQLAAPDRARSRLFAFTFDAMFAIGGAGADTVLYGFLLLLAGLPVYVWVRRSVPASPAA
jgi:hypothetical protein